MRIDEIILNENLPNEASIQRRFNFSSVDNRRFIYDPVSRRFVIGQLLPKSKSVYSSHSEEWFEATGSNQYFDRCVRGWFGTGGNYRNGIIHFAPPVNPYDDAVYACIKAFIASGATANTKLRGAPGSNEVTLGKEYPELFKLKEARLDELTIPDDIDYYLQQKGFARHSGMYANVYARPDDKYVLKVFVKYDLAYLEFLRLAQQHQDNPHFPKIKGKISEVIRNHYAIRMERLTTYHGDPDLIAFYIKNRDVKFDDPHGYSAMRMGDAEELFDEYPRLKEACDLIKDNLLGKYDLDLHSDNLMVRGSTIVFTDPVKNRH